MANHQLILVNYQGSVSIITRALGFFDLEHPGTIDEAAKEQGLQGKAGYKWHGVEVSPASLTKYFPELDERLEAAGAFCALLAIENGAPPIPEGTTYLSWAEGVSPDEGDIEFWTDCGALGARDLSTAEGSYMETLFSESPSE